MTQPAAIALDIPCRRCGYNLRGLDESGRCPECGTAVGLSTQGDLLRYADPHWLNKLKRGLWLMCAGALCVVLMQLQNFVLRIRMPYVAQPFVYFAFGLITIAGVWLVTAPDPAGLAEAQYVTARKLIRITIAIGLLYQLVSFASNARTLSPDAQLIMLGVSILVGLTGAVGEVAKFKYLAQLTARVPADRLTRYARTLMWWAGFIFGLGVIGSTMIRFVSLRRTPTTLLTTLSWMFMMQWLLQLVLLAGSVVLYVQLAAIVRLQEKFARRQWAVAEGVVAA